MINYPGFLRGSPNQEGIQGQGGEGVHNIITIAGQGIEEN